MAPLKEKDVNIQTQSKGAEMNKTSSPNTSKKRKSDVEIAESSTESKAPAAKRAKKTTTSDADKKDQTTKPIKKTASPATKKGKDETTESATAKPKTKTNKKKDEDEKDKYNIDLIHLEGENTISVPVYDTCNDIRTKINAHFRNSTPKISQAGLVREILKSFPPNDIPDSGISDRSLKTFLKKTGPNAGANMPIFYGAYVYFEKLRVKQDKKKSKKREEMEEAWGKKGMNLTMDASQKMWVHKDERVTIDKFGKMEFVRIR